MSLCILGASVVETFQTKLTTETQRIHGVTKKGKVRHNLKSRRHQIGDGGGILYLLLRHPAFGLGDQLAAFIAPQHFP